MKEQTLFWQPARDPMTPYADRYDAVGFEAAATERRDRLFRPHWERLHQLFRELPGGDYPVDDGDAVRVGDEGELDCAGVERLQEAITLLRPWRKGPFDLFNHLIDSEWRSNWKWDRIAPHLGFLANKKVCDVGCGNGYYMYRALRQEPAFVLGLDPSEIFFHQFHLVQRFARAEALRLEMLGVEHLRFFRELFDVVLCLGIIYHQRDPLAMLGRLRDALAPGGLAMVESMAIPGEEVTTLVPEGRYAKAKNVYHVPTGAQLVAWMQETGFTEVQVVSMERTTVEEQRATPFMVFESLADFLDPEDDTKTIEGHPAPWRVVVTGRKQGG